MAVPDHLKPFVLPVKPSEPERHGRVDLYIPPEAPPRPAIVFVHGGPVPAGATPTPRDWPVFQGYGSLAASRGCVGVTVDHRLHDRDSFPLAAEDVAAAVQLARDDPRVDADRVALWFFSGGGLLLGAWLRDSPSWLRCVAATYPMLGESSPAGVPVVLTRVGLERPSIAETVEAFIAAGHPSLTVIDVPHGHHSFDTIDDTDESREAVTAAFDAVLAHLTC